MLLALVAKANLYQLTTNNTALLAINGSLRLDSIPKATNVDYSEMSFEFSTFVSIASSTESPPPQSRTSDPSISFVILYGLVGGFIGICLLTLICKESIQKS